MASGHSDWSQFASPRQDQVSCGSCTGYMACAGTEGVTRQKYGTCPKLSEKDDFFCAGGTCSTGNTMANALNKAVRGIATLECCPDAPMPSGQDAPCGGGRCASWWTTGVKIASWQEITGLDNVLTALDEGIVVADMQCYNSIFNYVGGVYKHQAGESIVGGHAIVLWGYDSAQGCFLWFNSWGTGWGETPWGLGAGERGTCRLAFGEVQHFFKLVANGTVEPDPPTPSPCKVGNGWAKFLNLICKALGRKGRFYYLDPPA